MKPEHVLSPQRLIDPTSLSVVYTSPDDDWSLATMVYDRNPAVGIRWNGDINDPKDRGFPRAHNQGTWYILPEQPAALLMAAFVMGRATIPGRNGEPR